MQHHLLPAVLCQAQTEAVFISHATTDPLACWDAGLVVLWRPARLAVLPTCLPPTCRPVSVFLPVWKSLTDSLSVLMSDHFPSCVSAAFLDVFRPVAFFASPPACQSCCSLCHSYLLSGRLFFYLSAQLSVSPSGFLAERCLDRCWITSNPQIHHSHTSTETGREGETKEEEDVTDERRDKWRKRRRRGIVKEHIQ